MTRRPTDLPALTTEQRLAIAEEGLAIARRQNEALTAEVLDLRRDRNRADDVIKRLRFEVDSVRRERDELRERHSAACAVRSGR
jgi:chromosome segregation ATPase